MKRLILVLLAALAGCGHALEVNRAEIRPAVRDGPVAGDTDARSPVDALAAFYLAVNEEDLNVLAHLVTRDVRFVTDEWPEQLVGRRSLISFWSRAFEEYDYSVAVYVTDVRTRGRSALLKGRYHASAIDVDGNRWQWVSEYTYVLCRTRGSWKLHVIAFRRNWR